MYTDAQLRLSSAQALTTGTQISTNSIDLLSTNRNLGRGQPMRLIVTVDVSFASGTSVAVQYIESANSDLSTPTVIATSPVTVEASLVAGAKVWDIALPENTKRYVGVQYVNVGTHTVGKLSAHVVSDTDYNPYITSNTGR